MAKYCPIVGGLMGAGGVATLFAIALLDTDGRSKIELCSIAGSLIMGGYLCCGFTNSLYYYDHSNAPNVEIPMEERA
jgi:hypothetical protein